MAMIKFIPSKILLLVNSYEQILMVNNGIIVRAYEENDLHFIKIISCSRESNFGWHLRKSKNHVFRCLMHP